MRTCAPHTPLNVQTILLLREIIGPRKQAKQEMNADSHTLPPRCVVWCGWVGCSSSVIYRMQQEERRREEGETEEADFNSTQITTATNHILTRGDLAWAINKRKGEEMRGGKEISYYTISDRRLDAQCGHWCIYCSERFHIALMFIHCISY